MREIFEVINVSASYPVRFQTEPTGLGITLRFAED